MNEQAREPASRWWLRPRVVLGAILVILVVAFAVANGQDVNVDYLLDSTNAPLIYVILGSAIVGALADRLLVWRHRRRDDRDD